MKKIYSQAKEYKLDRFKRLNLINNPELSQIYNILEPICLDIAHRVIRWHSSYGEPVDEAKYLLEVSYRLKDNLLPAGHQIDNNFSIPALLPAIDYLKLIEQHIPEFMSGKLTGDEIIKKGGTDIWYKFNLRNPIMDIFSNAVSEKLVPIIPDKDVLELGGGCGGTTTRLVNVLNSTKSFMFTDLKSFFLKSIHEQIPQINFTTSILDLQSPPQNLPKMDIIFSTNAIHCASELKNILQWMKHQLNPKGMIVLGEGSPYSARCPWPYEIFFAFFKGWWNLPRSSERPYPGWLLPDQWFNLFEQAGIKDISLDLFLDDKRMFGGVYTAII